MLRDLVSTIFCLLVGMWLFIAFAFFIDLIDRYVPDRSLADLFRRHR